jgi:hypothetical protein
MTQRMTTRAYILRHASLAPSAHPLLSQASNAAIRSGPSGATEQGGDHTPAQSPPYARQAILHAIPEWADYVVLEPDFLLKND